MNRTYNDTAQVLSRDPTFSPRTNVYSMPSFLIATHIFITKVSADRSCAAFPNGAPALLVQLVGTLPVSFRGAVYRFPIVLWIPHTYPQEPPIAYVTPTSDMAVRPGQHVGGDGKIYHHYLAHWAEAWDVSVPLLSTGLS